MEFHFTIEEESFRCELRAWLESNLPLDYGPEEFAWGMSADERFHFQLGWRQKMHEGGWVGVHWPKEYDGRGATLMEQLLFHQELERLRAPHPANFLALLMAGPVIMHWGTEDQKRRFLPKLLSAEEI